MINLWNMVGDKVVHFIIMNAISNCTAMQFDALLLFMFFRTINKSLRILHGKNRWRINSFYSARLLEHINTTVTQLHLLISLPQMSSPTRNYFALPPCLHRLKWFLFQWRLKSGSFLQQFKVNIRSPNRHTWYSIVTQFALPLKMKPSRCDSTIVTWIVLCS